MTTLKVILGHIIIIVSFNNINAQYNQNLDSLIKVYNSLGDTDEKIKTVSYLFNAVVYTNPDSGYKYAMEELALSEKLNKIKGVGMGHYHLSTYYSILGNSDSSGYHSNKAMLAFKSINSLPDQGLVYSAIADEAYNSGKFDLAIANIDTVISIFMQLKQFYRVAVMQSFKSEILKDQGKYLLALDQAMKSLKVLDTLDRPVRKAEVLNIIANIELMLNNYQSAISYGEKSIPVFEKYEDNIRLTEVCITIGKAKSKLGINEDAMYYFTKAIELSEEYHLSYEKAESLLELGNHLIKQEKYSEAKNVLDKSRQLVVANKYLKIHSLVNLAFAELKILTHEYAEAEQEITLAISKSQEMNAIEGLAQAYRLRSMVYEHTGEKQKALQDYKFYHALMDSVLNKSKLQQIEELRFLYDDLQKDLQITQQQQEITSLKQEAKISKLKTSLLLIGLILLILIASFGFYAYKQRTKRHKLERKNLDTKLAFKKRELTSSALHLANKNELLENLKEQIKVLSKKNKASGDIQTIIQAINFNLQDNNNWENFKQQFDSVHKEFNSTIKKNYPEISSNELRLLALLKMNLTSKEIANILNISSEGVKKARYRLRKKLQIESDANLQDEILRI